MVQSRVRIEKIKVKDVYQFACETPDKHRVDGIVPITEHRALAHSNNPYADGEDIGLLVASMGDRCIGYIGIVPGLLRHGDQMSKVHWLSAFFVPPRFRNTAAALFLLESVQSLDYDIITGGLSRDAERVCRGMGFREAGTLVYSQVNIAKVNFPASGQALLNYFLMKRHIRFRAPCVADRVFYPLFKKLWYNFTSREFNRRSAGYSFREVNEISPDWASLTQHHSIPAEFYRGPEILNWMMKYPWVVESRKSDPTASAYFFSDTRPLFRNIPIAISSSDGGDERGFIILSVVSKRQKIILSVLDFNLVNPEVQQYACSVILEYAKKNRADCINLPESLASIFRSIKLIDPFVLKKKRIYFCHPKNEESPLAAALVDIRFDYCDGDTTYT